MAVFQLVCFVFLPYAYWRLYRVDPELLTLGPVIFFASWIGEATAIHFYGFYHYREDWWLRVAGVPVLIPLIWPAVLLSGRAVIRQLFPRIRGAMPLAVAMIVFFDAAMVEVTAVHCGLWAWTEPGYLGVPLIGVLGWAYFAFAATAILQHTAGPQRWLTLFGAPIVLHALLVASWWLFFRWHWRGNWFWLFVIVVVVFTLIALAVRGQRRMNFAIALPRIIAAGIFVGYLCFANPLAGRVWLHIALTSIPYALASEFQRKTLAGKPAPSQAAVQSR